MTEINEIISEIQGTLAEKKAIESENSEKINKIEEKLSSMEEINSKLNEISEEVKTVQKQLYRKTGSAGTGMMSEEIKDFSQFLKTRDVKFLRTDSDPDGGHLLPQELYNQIVSKVVEVSDFRKLARVVTIAGKGLEVPARDGDMTVYWVGEAGTVTQSQPNYNKLRVEAHKLMAEVRMTHELLGDAAFNMIEELTMRAALKFAQKEGAAFINGTGVGQPEGILQATGIGNVNSGNASTITSFDPLFEMMGNFKYRNPVFLMNRKTLAVLRKLKDANNQYIYGNGPNGAMGMTLGQPVATIAGVPVILMQDMPDVGAGNKPIALIDPQEAYMIVDRVGMSVVRDDLTLASNDEVKFVMKRRVGGKVINTEAVIGLTVAA